MTIKFHHLHIKTPDPKKTAQFYVDSFGAKIVSQMGDHGYRLDLDGLILNVTTFYPDQKRQQVYGMEHLSVETDDVPGLVATLTRNGARVLEDNVPDPMGLGRRICFVENPDGVQIEVLEKVRGKK